MRLAAIEKILESGDLSALRGRIPGGNARLQQTIKAFDKNGDGKLGADERAALMEFLKTVIQVGQAIAFRGLSASPMHGG